MDATGETTFVPSPQRTRDRRRWAAPTLAASSLARHPVAPPPSARDAFASADDMELPSGQSWSSPHFLALEREQRRLIRASVAAIVWSAEMVEGTPFQQESFGCGRARGEQYQESFSSTPRERRESAESLRSSGSRPQAVANPPPNEVEMEACAHKLNRALQRAAVCARRKSRTLAARRTMAEARNRRLEEGSRRATTGGCGDRPLMAAAGVPLPVAVVTDR
eukprot:gnl/TRDRNA2_/TRDRNA2_28758_c0_seq1.p1 gnl/TRDRNA2_/TRDRNA2_28758_c0~~gnl/TRDRNA2_/TRDRNA2_28758_c0_seq1.p1  ORF type:complete len:235 (+),score=33.01 gnl/TRDRNA2_/TRDRNA2_28758_c0_seq1:41-706(+)